MEQLTVGALAVLIVAAISWICHLLKTDENEKPKPVKRNIRRLAPESEWPENVPQKAGGIKADTASGQNPETPLEHPPEKKS